LLAVAILLVTREMVHFGAFSVPMEAAVTGDTTRRVSRPPCQIPLCIQLIQEIAGGSLITIGAITARDRPTSGTGSLPPFWTGVYRAPTFQNTDEELLSIAVNSGDLLGSNYTKSVLPGASHSGEPRVKTDLV